MSNYRRPRNQDSAGGTQTESIERTVGTELSLRDTLETIETHAESESEMWRAKVLLASQRSLRILRSMDESIWYGYTLEVQRTSRYGMEMHMHPEQHTVNSAALFHEVLNEMEKLDLE
ncbi:hypothetical protein Tco_0507765 [Tanacetum coccineum]